MSKKKLFKLLCGISLTSVMPTSTACSVIQENKSKNGDSVNEPTGKDDLNEKLTDDKNNSQPSNKDKENSEDKDEDGNILNGNKLIKVNSNIRELSSTKIEEIDPKAFSEAPFLHTINLPNVRTIKDYSFFKMLNKLESLTLGVNQIPSNAFENNYHLKFVSLPNVGKIGGEAFKGAESLTSINLPNV
ncbi:leucine-rich repeat protein, partial [Mycoplasmopsis opalescens]|uniref:leucine-rich repeat protein n=1 Tax=Mycoplasmopsis opalescens TaxID=114886 RepID=UPI0005634028